MNSKNMPQKIQKNPVISTSDEINASRPAALVKHRSILHRLFPTKFQKAIIESDLIQAKTELEYREKALRMLKDAQIQAIQEKYNEFLKTGKSIIRSDSGLFFANKLSEFEGEMNTICNNFYQVIENQYDKLKDIKIPYLKVIAEDRIEESAIRFKESVNKIMADFIHILDEGV